MKRSGLSLISSSFVRDVHVEWTRPDCDERSFVYCTFMNNKRGWVSKDSILSTRPDLSLKIATKKWSKMRDGGRMKARPTTDDVTWFRIVHPDAPNQPVHDDVVPLERRGSAHELTLVARVYQLEVNYATLLNLIVSGNTHHTFTSESSVSTHQSAFTGKKSTITCEEDTECHASEVYGEHSSSCVITEDEETFDLDAFVTMHSFSEVSTPQTYG